MKGRMVAPSMTPSENWDLLMPDFQIHTDIRQLPLTVDAFLEMDPTINNIALGVLTQMRNKPEAFSNY
jgi:hypothetical protein